MNCTGVPLGIPEELGAIAPIETGRKDQRDPTFGVVECGAALGFAFRLILLTSDHKHSSPLV